MRNQRILHWVIAAVVVGVFLLDWATPLGWAEWVLYLLPIGGAYWSARRLASLYLAGICSVLTIVGLFLSPHGISMEASVFNRAVAIVVFCLIGALIERMKNLEGRLREEAAALARLNAVNSRLWHLQGLGEGLYEMLGATIDLLGADKGNVQILDADRGVLHIAAQRGFEQEFLDFFREVSTRDDSACGRALRSGTRMIIDDVETDAPYAPYREVARAAGYRAVQSTPLIGRDGTPLGMLSTHWRLPHRPSKQDLRRLDLYVCQAAAFVERCRISQTLRGRETLLRAATDNASVGLVMLDRHRRYLFVNQAYCKILGLRWTAEELIGKGPAEMLAEVYASQISPNLDRAFAGERVSYELARPRPNAAPGEMDQYVVVYDPQRDESDGVDGVIVTIFDITQRKQAEDALKASNERLKKVLEIETVGVMFWDLTTGCLVDANDTFLTMMGYSRADVEAHDLTWQKFTPPEYHEVSLAEIRKFQASGRVGPYEKEYFRKDGTRHWLLFAGSSLGGNQCVEFCVDIAARKKAEQALRASEERLRAILNTAMDAIITINEQGIIQSLNPATERIFGYTAAEMVGQNVKMLMPSPYREQHDKYLRRYLETGQARIIGNGREVVGRCKDGRTFPVDLALNQVDHLGLFTGIIRDISRRKELEREIVEIASLEQRRIGQDLHDSVGQELTALSLLASDLADVLRTNQANWDQLIERMVNGLSRCRQELRSVMQGLLPVAVDTEGLMAALADLADRTKQEGLAGCFFVCREPVYFADNLTATHLFLIAKEAVHNALKHGQPKNIRITLRSDGQVVLSLQDDGIGIAEQAPENPGLGLRIMRNRAAIISASLTVERAQPTGTVVTCTMSRKNHAQE